MGQTSEPKKISLATYCLILTIIVIIIMAIVLYFLNKSKGDESTKVEQMQATISTQESTISELQNKINTIGETISSNTESSNANLTSNDYSTFSKKLQESYKAEESNSIKNKIAKTIEIDGEYYVFELTYDGTLNVRYFNTSNGNNEKNAQIATNVSNFYVFNIGQDNSNQLVIIYNDGTAAKLNINGTSNSIYNGNYNPTKIENAKDIVSAASVLQYDEIDGGYGYILIDINGNIIK